MKMIIKYKIYNQIRKIYVWNRKRLKICYKSWLNKKVKEILLLNKIKKKKV